MSSRGTLYIDEECRDTFQAKLDNWFGKDMWQLDGSPFSDYWDLANFPEVVEVNVKDMETDEIIGKVEITSEFDIWDNYGERYIETSPKSIKLLEIDKLRQIVKEKINQIEVKNETD